MNSFENFDFYKISFLDTLGVKFHATALGLFLNDAQKQGASIKKKIDAVAWILTPKVSKKLIL